MLLHLSEVASHNLVSVTVNYCSRVSSQTIESFEEVRLVDLVSLLR